MAMLEDDDDDEEEEKEEESEEVVRAREEDKRQSAEAAERFLHDTFVYIIKRTLEEHLYPLLSQIVD